MVIFPIWSKSLPLHLCLLSMSLLLIVVPLWNKTPSQEVLDQSLLSAAQFLYLVDTEEYARSWEVTSSRLQEMIPQESWNAQINKIRKFLGPISDRVQHSVSYTNSASDVPIGEYVVMTFVSSFAFREGVVETLTLMLDEHDSWQVAGYFLR